MSKVFPTKCLVDGCTFGNKITAADIKQMRFHLVQRHDYLELQDTALKLGLVQRETKYRPFGWFVRKLAEACIIPGIEM